MGELAEDELLVGVGAAMEAVAVVDVDAEDAWKPPMPAGVRSGGGGGGSDSAEIETQDVAEDVMDGSLPLVPPAEGRSGMLPVDAEAALWMCGLLVERMRICCDGLPLLGRANTPPLP